MASVVITIKVMPTGPDKDLGKIEEYCKKEIVNFVDEKHKEDEIRVEIEEIGFGIKALKFTFVYDEAVGASDKLEEALSSHEDIESVEAVDVRRAIG